MATLKVTINGQLMIMMLCEELELNGIEVVSANTDGIVVKLYKSKKETFDKIAANWKKLTGLDADSEEYLYYINRDIEHIIGVLTL
jgi:DNA polymerase elongation subunit (family B)